MKLKAKISEISATSLKLDQANTELLATKYLLNEEENKCTEYEQDIENLTTELSTLNEVTTKLQDDHSHSSKEANDLREKLEVLEVRWIILNCV